MNKSMAFVEEGTDISRYLKLKAFLKRMFKYKSKKSSIFTRQQVTKITNDTVFIRMKKEREKFRPIKTRKLSYFVHVVRNSENTAYYKW